MADCGGGSTRGGFADAEAFGVSTEVKRVAAHVAVFPEEGFGMAERSNAEVGFTAEDRKILYQVEVRMERLEKDVGDVRAEVRDGLSRIVKLEADRVGRKDVEDLLQVIEEKQDENAKMAVEQKAMSVRLESLEKRVPDIEFLKKYAWIGIGISIAIQFAFSRIWK